MIISYALNRSVTYNRKLRSQTLIVQATGSNKAYEIFTSYSIGFFKKISKLKLNYNLLRVQPGNQVHSSLHNTGWYSHMVFKTILQ